MPRVTRKVLDAVAESHGDDGGMLVVLGDWNFSSMADLHRAMDPTVWTICAPAPYRDVISVLNRPGMEPP